MKVWGEKHTALWCFWFRLNHLKGSLKAGCCTCMMNLFHRTRSWLHERHQAALTEKGPTKAAHMRALVFHESLEPLEQLCQRGRISVAWAAGVSRPLNSQVEKPPVSSSTLHIEVATSAFPRLVPQIKLWDLFQLWGVNHCLLNFHIMDQRSALLQKCSHSPSTPTDF